MNHTNSERMISMKKMNSAGLVIGGMLLGMGALYVIERKQRKSIEEMLNEAKDTIDSMMN